MFQDMARCTAEYHLSQSALCVGALDQQVATQRICSCKDRLAGIPAIKVDR